MKTIISNRRVIENSLPHTTSVKIDLSNDEFENKVKESLGTGK